jgi:hypothetical protein
MNGEVRAATQDYFIDSSFSNLVNNKMQSDVLNALALSDKQVFYL